MSKKAMEDLDYLVRWNLRPNIEYVKEYRKYKGCNPAVADYMEDWFFRHPHIGRTTFSYNSTIGTLKPIFDRMETGLGSHMKAVANGPYLGPVMRAVYSKVYP